MKVTLKEELPMVPIEEQESCLADTLWKLSMEQPFFGSALQVMNIQYSQHAPTAGVGYNDSTRSYELYVGPHFFCRELKTADERKAVLLHELLHVTHGHLARHDPAMMDSSTRRVMNIAMDMAINQYINNLPEFGVDVNKVKDPKTGKLLKWEKLQSTEYYFAKLRKLQQEQDENGEQSGDGEGDEEQQSGEGGDKTIGGQKNHDEHGWESDNEREKLEAADDLMKRAMIKSGLGYSQLPKSIQDMLDKIKSRRAELNYKAMLLLALKASLPANVRVHSWTRKSRRFGHLSPGTTYGENPKLEIFIDTSGSISIEEANQFLDVVDEFLQVGSRECNLNLFHTVIYHSQKYRRGEKIDRSIIESGGTELTQCFEKIASKRPDLALFLTDGSYDNVDVESMTGSIVPNTVFVISRDGTSDHPFKNRKWAHTFQIPK